MASHPFLWAVSCSVKVTADDGSSLTYDFEEDQPTAPWNQCIAPILRDRTYRKKGLWVFDLKPPPREPPLLLPMRRPHELRVTLRLPAGAGQGIEEFVFSHADEKWETAPRDNAYRNGWRDKFSHGRLSLMLNTELQKVRASAAAVEKLPTKRGLLMGKRRGEEDEEEEEHVDPTGQNVVVREIAESRRPHLSLMARRHLEPEQIRTIETAKPGSPSPVFLGLPPESFEIERVVLAVDPIVFTMEVVSKMAQAISSEVLSRRIYAS